MAQCRRWMWQAVVLLCEWRSFFLLCNVVITKIFVEITNYITICTEHFSYNKESREWLSGSGKTKTFGVYHGEIFKNSG